MRAPLAWALDLSATVARLGEQPHLVVLTGRWADGGALVAWNPARVLADSPDPFRALVEDSWRAGCRADDWADVVGGGWIGWIGFSSKAHVDGHHDGYLAGRSEAPKSWLAWYPELLRMDAAGRWWYEAIDSDSEGSCSARAEFLSQWLAAQEPTRWDPLRCTPFVPNPSSAGQSRAISAARRRIAEGDLYQANLTARWSAEVRSGSLLGAWLQAGAQLEPAYAAYLSAGATAIASLSPELFLRRRGDSILSSPMKGTAADAVELERSDKDRAENVMIVDLVRADFGRVCAPGTIKVESLCDVRPGPGVWQLVSDVTGTLADGEDDASLLRATFPPASVSGAPKPAALNTISELESTPREAYCGAIGFRSPAWGLELSVAIRTIERVGDRIWVSGGGGITAGSVPVLEVREAEMKIEPLVAALDGQRLAPPHRGGEETVPCVDRLGGQPPPRPDPRAGILETLLWRHGAAQRFADHLARLQLSALELWDEVVPPEEVRDAVRAAVRGCAEREMRLRLLKRPGEPVICTASELSSAQPSYALRPMIVPGGLGPHKWADRRWVDQLSGAAAPALPLLCDLDGRVLEVSRANIIAMRGNAVITPPLDGRILPGVGRAHYLTDAARRGLNVVEREIRLSDLDSFDELQIVSSLRGAVPAYLSTRADASVGG